MLSNADEIILDKKKGKISTISKFMSYPPLTTGHFNSDGSTQFRSRMQLVIALPLLVGLVAIFLIYLLPLMSSDYVQIDIDEKDLILNKRYQVDVDEDLPIGWMTWFYMKFNKKFVVTNKARHDFNSTCFLDNFYIRIFGPNQSALEEQHWPDVYLDWTGNSLNPFDKGGVSTNS